MTALDGRRDLNWGICNGPAHLLGQFAGQHILLLFQDLQSARDDLLALCKCGGLRVGSEGLLGGLGDALHIIGGGAGAGDNRTIGRGGNSGNCFGHCDGCLVKLSGSMQWSPEYEDRQSATRGASVISSPRWRGVNASGRSLVI